MRKSFVVAALCLTLLALPAFAAGPSKSLALPIGGNFTDAAGGTGTFAGTFLLQQFAVVNNQLVGQGTLTGTMTSSTGMVLGSVYKQISIPVSFPSGTASSDFVKSSNALGTIGITATCEILHLDLGPLSLNLLGLQVNLSEVVLDISAQQGPGNLLGNLLCAVANLLNGGLNLGGILGQISTLLNQILGVLAGL